MRLRPPGSFTANDFTFGPFVALLTVNLRVACFDASPFSETPDSLGLPGGVVEQPCTVNGA